MEHSNLHKQHLNRGEGDPCSLQNFFGIMFSICVVSKPASQGFINFSLGGYFGACFAVSLFCSFFVQEVYQNARVLPCFSWKGHLVGHLCWVPKSRATSDRDEARKLSEQLQAVLSHVLRKLSCWEPNLCSQRATRNLGRWLLCGSCDFSPRPSDCSLHTSQVSSASTMGSRGPPGFLGPPLF